jgi:hypothetical protein
MTSVGVLWRGARVCIGGQTWRKRAQAWCNVVPVPRRLMAQLEGDDRRNGFERSEIDGSASAMGGRGWRASGSP